ncbi:MAG: TrkH family potassium uptake protein [Candidatus Gygaella obscura]|nr:TrkH family potassium uptake protein [Candidatus Gygaella obscura]
MILRPQLKNFKTIGYYIGKILIGLGFIEIIPLIVAVFLGELNPALDFAIGASVTLIVGFVFQVVFFTDRPIEKIEGLTITAISWILAMFLAAIPLYLSGHWVSFLDACFDSMSGLATTGLSLVTDLDHLSKSHNIWRHLLMFIGGQGIVIVALSFFTKGLSGAFSMYVGEARDEKILPNVIHTARFIWIISLIYFLIGVLALTVVGYLNGLSFFSSIFHGVCIFMAAFDTGGFTPQSQSIIFYHSWAFELTTIVIMVLGAVNFNLHYCFWFGRRKEIFKDAETRTFLISLGILGLIVGLGLFNAHTYLDKLPFLRKGLYQIISAHTGTGYATIYAKQFISEWGDVALFGMIVAMSIGGATCSTTGAIKLLRVSVFFKTLFKEIKKAILPERAVLVQKIHHVKDIILSDKLIKASLLIILFYIFLYAIGTLAAMLLGYPFLNSLFESTSAAANVGLSCGITQPSMPYVLKLVYIIQMWVGRLEFISVFAILGVIVASIKGK